MKAVQAVRINHSEGKHDIPATIDATTALPADDARNDIQATSLCWFILCRVYLQRDYLA
jgi:hypothetical protein